MASKSKKNGDARSLTCTRCAGTGRVDLTPALDETMRRLRGARRPLSTVELLERWPEDSRIARNNLAMRLSRLVDEGLVDRRLDPKSTAIRYVYSVAG